jgi:hypothetical protein
MCGVPEHSGKCPRPERGRFWCGVCLEEKLFASEVERADPSLLLAAGVHKTARWCVRCGSPVCKLHRDMGSAYRRAHARCTPDCRLRPQAVTVRITKALQVHVPDYLTAGPVRCTVCRLPAYRRNLCQRHYTAVRAGKTELYAEAQRKVRGYKSTTVAMYCPTDTYEAAKDLAHRAGKTFSAWANELIEREVELKTGVKPRLLRTIYGTVLKSGERRK